MNKEKTAFTADENDILMMADKIRQNQKENEAFKEQLERFLDENKVHTNTPLIIGATPYSLAISGADEKLSLVISPKTILKCIGNPDEIYHGHKLSKEILEQLPDELRNPALILKGSHEGSLIAVTELKDNENRNVIIAVQLDSHSDWQTVNRITSAYGRNNFTNYLDKQINANDNLIAINKEKADEMLRPLGLQLPPGKSFINFNDSIAYTTENVKYPEQENYEILENGTKILRDGNGRITYHEDSDGNWEKWKYNEQGLITYYENSNGNWQKYEYNEQGKETYSEDNYGWEKWEYNEQGKLTYWENSNGEWEKYEYDEQSREIYYENESGYCEKHEYDEQGELISGHRTENQQTQTKTQSKGFVQSM